MQQLQSKIKSIFCSELLDLTASVCDTRRINSLQDKMKIIGDLLYTYDVKWGLLGGATNRFVVFVDGYAAKFALDHQGYRDNFIEYSICEELQPSVTRSYETNGYVTIAECVRTISESEFIARKQDVINILRMLSDSYLLGDVGYLKKNFTNWGVRDNGELVILDYAYVHRATETLFTCPVCGEGILSYDNVFDKLMCTNKTICHAKFTYEDIKAIQGEQVDLDMIEERKRMSLIVSGKNTYANVEKPNKKGRLITRDGKSVIIVDNDELYRQMMEEKNMIAQKFKTPEALDMLVEVALADSSGDELEKNTIIQDFQNLISKDSEVTYELDPDYESERIGRKMDNKFIVHGPFDKHIPGDECTDRKESVPDDTTSLDDLVSMIVDSNLKEDSVQGIGMNFSLYDDEGSFETILSADMVDHLMNDLMMPENDYAGSDDVEDESSYTALLTPESVASIIGEDYEKEEDQKIGVVLDGVMI